MNDHRGLNRFHRLFKRVIRRQIDTTAFQFMEIKILLSMKIDDIYICVIECRGAIKSTQSRETGNWATQKKEKQNKNTSQYVLDTTIRKQTQIT